MQANNGMVKIRVYRHKCDFGVDEFPSLIYRKYIHISFVLLPIMFRCEANYIKKKESLVKFTDKFEY